MRFNTFFLLLCFPLTWGGIFSQNHFSKLNSGLSPTLEHGLSPASETMSEESKDQRAI